MANIGRSRLPFVAAGVLALVALAAFLILDLAGGSVDPSSLPVIEIGQSGSSQPGQGSGAAGARASRPGLRWHRFHHRSGIRGYPGSADERRRDDDVGGGYHDHREHSPRDRQWWSPYREHGLGWRSWRNRCGR